MQNSSHSHLFISQIDVVFNNESLREFYFSESNKAKRSLILKMIIQKLTNNYRSKDLDYSDLSTMSDESHHSNQDISTKTISSKNANTLFHMNCDNALNLLAAVRSFIFTSCNYEFNSEEDTFRDLIEFLIQGMGNE